MQSPKSKRTRMTKTTPTTKNRKIATKQEKDYISETISFVIKGQLTPIKSSFISKNKMTAKKTKKITDNKKLPTKKIKKTETTKTKTASKKIVTPKVTKKTSQTDINVQDNLKKDIKRATKKVKIEPVDAKKNRAKKEVVVKSVKTTTNIKKKVKQDVEQLNKKAEDLKTKQTIEKLLKQANKALKQPQLKIKSNLKNKQVKKLKAKDKKEPNKSAIDKLKLLKKNKPKVVRQSSIKSDIKEKIKKQLKRKSDSSVDDSKSHYINSNDSKQINDVKLEKADQVKVKKKKIKNEATDTNKKSNNKMKKKISPKSNLVLMKKRLLTKSKESGKQKENQRNRKMKLFGFWNGPKRHRVASLNALAKVHCLYENETRNNLIDPVESDKKEQSSDDKSDDNDVTVSTRTLRSVPGLRAVGKHWDMHDTSSSSEDNEISEIDEKLKKIKKESNKKDLKKIDQKKRRNRSEIIMDLKDMVVRKRMASLNATAILAASYSVEKKSKSPRSDDSETDDSSDYFLTTDNEQDKNSKCDYEDDVKKEIDSKNESKSSPKRKVAVILNQDTDVTITGVYVNSTTRSTHHEGYCSIAGMQYRISATSHTQTAATAVATETLLQSSSSSAQENSNSESLTSCKSYTPLDALSNMQPPPGPGIQHHTVIQPPAAPPPPHHHPHLGPPQHVLPLTAHQLSPSGRRHGCPSAFSYPHPSGHHHPLPPLAGEPGYVHGYYQPAGPLISVAHGHTQVPPPPPPQSQMQSQASLVKNTPLSDMSPNTVTSPPTHQPPPPPSSNGDSSDSEVIITSVTAGKESIPPPNQQPPPTYRYTQYAAPPGYSYTYPHYYPTPPPPPPPPAPPTYAHHDLCYPPAPFIHPKYPTYRRFLPNAQYYTSPNAEIYSTQPTGTVQPTQQVVTATPVSASGATFSATPNGPPTILETYQPAPTLVETYPHPPPHYYPSYGPAPPPSCYTHSPPTRTIPFINATYQSCPCPMQSCPKNGLTGPLTGDNSKRSNVTSISKESMPLPPVALALPLEPASATGPPSPARGSAGMPPPPSPAGATYHQTPSSLIITTTALATTMTTTEATTTVATATTPTSTKQESVSPEIVDGIIELKKRKARVGKAMVRNNIAAIQQNTMLLMCNPISATAAVATAATTATTVQKNFVGEVKREIESPKDEKKQICLNSNKEQENDAIITASMKKENDKKQLQIVRTVAENVKVKNMKRKLSVTKEITNGNNNEKDNSEESKKLKIDGKFNGSYKDLIKKDNNLLKLNINKRKLIVQNNLIKTTNKTKTKKPTKRKLNINSKEEIVNNKRIKQIKPLSVSNFNNNKPTTKEKLIIEPIQNENKEPQKKKKNSVNLKKLAPAILDTLMTKNSIDRTIENVISESIIVRTNNNNNNKDNNSSALKTCVKNNKEPVNKKSTNCNIKNNGQNKCKIECCNKKNSNAITRRKSKCKEKEVIPQVVTRIPRRSLHLPKWSNGWMWDGTSYEAKVFLNSDETTVVRKCYPAMRHEEGDIIEVKDCVLLKAGPRKNDLPFVAKIAALWENPEDGEMMMSLLWYYRPEHTEQGRLPIDQPDEVFASRHKDSNSVACIDDKCYVLTFHEYCRYRKTLRRLEEGLEETLPCIPIPEPYPRYNRQPSHPLQVSPDMVFFCRRVYDFRQKRIVKNPS